jgi:predicted aconitase
MALHLSPYDRECLEGKHGPAKKTAMAIVAQMAEVQNATELLSITQAHIDATVYVGDAGLEFAEHLMGLGAKVAVPSTLNVSGVDEHGWREWAVPEDWAEKARRQMIAYESMGTIPIWTCTPYQTQYRPEFGEQIAWGESNAIVFANSVIGARTERYPDMLDVCCAITGRVPAVGLHMRENRRGDILIRLVDIPHEIQRDDTFFTVLGYLLGKTAGNRIPVVDGIGVNPTEDQLKALGATAASSGAVALFHMVGVTPEAPTVDAAFHGKEPSQVTEVTMHDLRNIRRELTTADGESLDMVVLGSPHLSLEEFKQLLPWIQHERLHPDVQFLVTTNRAVAHLVERAGAMDTLRAFGARVTVDTCILTTPMLPNSIKTIMTNAGKFAYYTPGLLNRQVVFGSLRDCIRSAIAGRVIVEDSLWEM